jgi:hypothetical protein
VARRRSSQSLSLHTLPVPGRSVAEHASDEGSPALPADAAPPPAGLTVLRVLGAGIAWLSGSLAAITAIFYAFGYLATLANLDMLGLDVLAFHYDSTFYIQRGADALLLSGTVIGGFWLWLFVALAIAAAAGELLHGHGWRPAANPPAQRLARHLAIAKACSYVGLLVLMLWLVVWIWALFPFPEDLRVSGMLYPDTGSAAARQIRDWIIAGNEPRLQEHYDFFVMQQGIITVLLALSWGLTYGWRWRTLAVLPFAVIFVISLAWLPLEYGKVALQPKFSPVLVRLGGSPQAAEKPPGTMYLLNKTDNEFVLWDPRQRQIVWLPSRALASVDISAKQTLSQVIASSREASR